MRLGEVHDIDPVPRPALAIQRASQQPIDKPLVSARRVVGHKCSHLLRRGGQPDQIEVDAADQRAAVRRRRGGQMVPCQIGRHKGVNRVVQELTVRNRCTRRLREPAAG